jgi:hypothetical protein
MDIVGSLIGLSSKDLKLSLTKNKSLQICCFAFSPNSDK